jgi:hypothetical protein
MILLMVFSRTQKSPNKIGAFGLPVHGTGLKFLSVTFSVLMLFRSFALKIVVRMGGLEPPQPKLPAPQAGASTNSATSA